MRRLLAGAWATGGVQDLTLPDQPASLEFAAIGDNGNGEQPEYDVARSAHGTAARRA